MNTSINEIEKLLLPSGAHFSDDAKEVISCWNSTDVSACPGSGKTTVLLAKLKILADRMPLENGKGVCVLSHTNVAVNEIKARLSNCADKLLNYPNYVGTIQSFIDTFIVKPYLKTITSASLQIVDDDVFAYHLSLLISNDKNYNALQYLLKCRYNEKIYQDKIDMVKDLYSKDGTLYLGNQKRALAGKDSNSAKQYVSAISNLLKTKGMIRYKDAYKYAEEAINKLSEDYLELFTLRFKYVFIDEYQDCDNIQRRALSKVFDSSKSCVMCIGDPDQAIYNFNQQNQEDWIPNENSLSIASSNRYGQSISNVLNNLKKRNTEIVSAIGAHSINPVLLVFDDETRSNVVNKYIEVLKNNDLTDPNGIYKVIGAIKKKSLSGLKISDYWANFSTNDKNNENNYWTYIHTITSALQQGKGYLVELNIRRLLCKILKFIGIKYRVDTIKEKLNNDYFEIYRNDILNLFSLGEFSKDTIDVKIKELINKLISSTDGCTVWDKIPLYFLKEAPFNENNDDNNTLRIPQLDIKIQFDTIHGVKGETHDATLYLETEKSGVSDIKRILPYFGVGNRTSDLSDYCRKCAYVGMSRPRKLLCLAIHKKTYEISEDAFSTWDIIEC